MISLRAVQLGSYPKEGGALPLSCPRLDTDLLLDPQPLSCVGIGAPGLVQVLAVTEEEGRPWSVGAERPWFPLAGGMSGHLTPRPQPLPRQQHWQGRAV
jgi:hypothetical protein